MEAGRGQIGRGPRHHVREHGLYPESAQKQLKGLSYLSNVITFELQRAYLTVEDRQETQRQDSVVQVRELWTESIRGKARTE